MIRAQRKVHVLAWVVVPVAALAVLIWGVALSGPVSALDADQGDAATSPTSDASGGEGSE